jgi:hypothetical protein
MAPAYEAPDGAGIFGGGMTAPARFTQADIKRATSGVLSAGVSIAKITIDPRGRIVIIPGTPKTKDGENEWADLE